MKQRMKFVAAFAVVYLVWGSTYLAIKTAVTEMPPYLMMGVRFLIAGAVLLAVFARKGSLRLTREQWRGTAVLTFAMIILGVGVVGWVECYVPSGIVALITAVTPVWLVFLESLAVGSIPGWRGLTGVFVGLLGLSLLITPESFGGQIAWLPLAVLLLSSFSWAAGSIYARHQRNPLPQMVGTALHMVLGGAALVVIGLLFGERVDVSAISSASVMGLLYLITFGSLLVFPTYMWLMKNCSPALVGTHAYVNPLVALALGYLFADEPITSRTVLAATIIISSVFLIAADRTGAKPAGRPRRKLFSNLQDLFSKKPAAASLVPPSEEVLLETP